MNSHEKIISFTKLIAIFLFFTGTLTLVYGIIEKFWLDYWNWSWS